MPFGRDICVVPGNILLDRGYISRQFSCNTETHNEKCLKYIFAEEDDASIKNFCLINKAVELTR